jgi:hypothetical protein
MRARRRPYVVVLVMLAVGLLAACSSSGSTSSSSSSSSSAAASTGTTSSKASGPAAAADEIGITPTEIHLAFIADVNTSVVPGLFQKSVDVFNAWAAVVNKNGGVAGRKIVVDFCDGKLDANATTSCVIKACQNDFSIVSEVDVLTDVSDIDQCKDKKGQATGIPNQAIIAFQPQTCDKFTYTIQGQASYCATINQKPQSYTVNIGDFKYYTSHFSGLHGIWVYNGDVPAVRIASVPQFTAGSNLGIKKDGEGFYTSNGQAPQSAMTAFTQVLKRSGSNFAYDGATNSNYILLRREAQLQGVNNIKVWASNSGIYDADFIKQGGSAVEGTTASLSNLPFYSEYKSNPALSALVDQLGGVNKLSNNSLGAFTHGLLFEDAAAKAVATGKPLTRASFLEALNNEHAFDAKGVIGKTDIGAHTLSPCIVIITVKNGKFERVAPTAPGTFDCDPGNVTTIKMDLTK